MTLFLFFICPVSPRNEEHVSHVEYYSLYTYFRDVLKHLLYRCNLQSRQMLSQVDQCTHLKSWLKNTKVKGLKWPLERTKNIQWGSNM